MLEVEGFEPIRDFESLGSYLNTIALRMEEMRGRPARTKHMRAITEAFSLDHKLRAQITHRLYVAPHKLSAFHVSIRESHSQPWQQHTLNLGVPVVVQGVEYWQVIRPSESNKPRTSYLVSEFSKIPLETQTVFAEGLGLFALKGAQTNA